MISQNIKATASDAYELLTSVKSGATLIVSREDAINWMGDDFQGDENEPTDADCEALAEWLNQQREDYLNKRGD